MKNERSIRFHERKFQENPYEDDQVQQDEYSITLKKAEVAAAAKLACAYLGIQKKIKFDRDISVNEILKYEAEINNL